MVKNLSHKSGLVAMFTVGKLNKILKPYTEVKKLPEFDFKLFKSFFAKDVNLTKDLTVMSALHKTNPIRESLTLRLNDDLETEILNLGIPQDNLPMVAAIKSPDPKQTVKTASVLPINTQNRGLD
jgi:hypothetical protein